MCGFTPRVSKAGCNRPAKEALNATRNVVGSVNRGSLYCAPLADAARSRTSLKCSRCIPWWIHWGSDQRLSYIEISDEMLSRNFFSVVVNISFFWLKRAFGTGTDNA